MGLVFQRHLSLLLVVALTAGWFLVPVHVLSEDGASTTNTNKVTTVSSEQLLFGNTAVNLPKETQLTKQTFTKEQDGKVIIHKFQINDPRLSNNVYQQRYVYAPDLPVWAGCFLEEFGPESSLDKSISCRKESPVTYNYFRLDNRPPPDDSTAPDPILGRTQTTKTRVYAQARAYQFENHPNDAPMLIHYDNYIYGIYTLDQPSKRYLRTEVNTPTRPLGVYILAVNRLRFYQLQNSKLDLSTNDEKTKVQLIREVVKQIFGGISMVKGHLKLTDDKANSSEKSLGLTPPAPDSPPIVTVSGGLSVGSKAVFRLNAAPRVKAKIYGTDNNYFFFQLLPASDTSQEIVDQLGGNEAIKNVYLVIDLMGNIGFVVDNPADDGGIFKTEAKQTTVKDSIVIGEFDARNGNASANAGGPGRIELSQYQETIATRVYNEPSLVSKPRCATPKIDYPDLNTKYTVGNRFQFGIPDDLHRECINIDPKGWLDVWGVKSKALDQPTGDPCKNVMGLFNPMKALCRVVYALAGIAITFAKFSVDFLVESVGVQT